MSVQRGSGSRHDEAAKPSSPLIDTRHLITAAWKSQPVRYTTRDLILYAVGIGCTDLRFVFENEKGFSAFPTYPFVLGFKGVDADVVPFPSPAMQRGAVLPQLPGVVVALDGEREIVQLAPLDHRGGELTMRSRIIGIHKRGSGAIIDSEAELFDMAGNKIYRIISGTFLVGAKGFADAGRSNSEKIPVPSRPADAVDNIPTSVEQAQVYRLSGDYNALHIDPAVALRAGFKRPILHGLCSYGMTARAVLKHFCGNDAGRFRSMKARFAAPVLPGQTLRVEMWRVSARRVVVRSSVVETGKVCILNAYVETARCAQL
jgi:acyl dehydratase